jgi:hypothetical protein
MLEQIIRLSIHADWLALGLWSHWCTGCNHHADHAARSERGRRGVASHILAVRYRRDSRSRMSAAIAR